MEDTIADINRLVQGFKVSRVMGALAEVGVADHLPPEETRTVGELASQCKVSSSALRRSLRLLCAWGIFSLESQDRLRHTPMSLLLRSDHPRTVRYVVRSLTASGSWRGWEAFTDALYEKNPHQSVWGMGRFAHLAAHPLEGCWFDEYMARAGDNRHVHIAETYNFPVQGTVVDVGGGNGELLRQVLQRQPKLDAILFDQPDVISRLTPAELLEGRIRPSGGSFFEAVPTSGDIYILTKVLHDWSDADATRILRTVRQSMSANARLLVNEVLLNSNPGEGNFMHYASDIQMMTMFDGARERTQEEFEALGRQAGLKLTKAISAGPIISILEVVPLS